jgi:RNA polymerase sigma-70 factor (ECF subfamily)
MDGLAITPAFRRLQPFRPTARRRAIPQWRRPQHEGASDAMTGAKTSAKAQTAVDPADLIERVARSADREAFAGLFSQFAPRLKSYLMGLGAPAAAAEELVQETLLTVWRKAASFDRARAGAATWIFTIARNLRIDAARRERTALAYSINLTDEPEAPESPDDLASAREREGRVRAALTTLPPDQAEVVRLAFFQEKPHSEIADVLGIPLGTVKSRVRLAMSRLRERLEDLL